jgi:hypothetical protein
MSIATMSGLVLAFNVREFRDSPHRLQEELENALPLGCASQDAIVNGLRAHSSAIARAPQARHIIASFGARNLCLDET